MEMFRQQTSRVLPAAAMRLLVFIISFSLAFGPSVGYAQTAFLNLPLPGTMVSPSPAFVPVLLKGMTIHPDNPLRFDFIVDSGNTDFAPPEVQAESERLVKYFLAAMTVPQDDLWVNLSPGETDRIIPDELGKTELGRDMLAQDYLLKQMTASLMYPEKGVGRKFWQRVREQARRQFGTSDIPVDTFNKVWIIPESATVYENDQTVYVVGSRLKVLLDEDYLAQQDRQGGAVVASASDQPSGPAAVSGQIVREIILPELEREVNEGANFAPLRQIYHSLILAKWYKATIKDSLLSSVYIDQNKTAGIDLNDPEIKDKIYAQYMQAYEQGVFNFIKEDYDQLSRTTIPRKYFSGGERLGEILIDTVTTSSPIKGRGLLGKGFTLLVSLTAAALVSTADPGWANQPQGAPEDTAKPTFLKTISQFRAYQEWQPPEVIIDMNHAPYPKDLTHGQTTLEQRLDMSQLIRGSSNVPLLEEIFYYYDIPFDYRKRIIKRLAELIEKREIKYDDLDIVLRLCIADYLRGTPAAMDSAKMAALRKEVLSLGAEAVPRLYAWFFTTQPVYDYEIMKWNDTNNEAARLIQMIGQPAIPFLAERFINADQLHYWPDSLAELMLSLGRPAWAVVERLYRNPGGSPKDTAERRFAIIYAARKTDFMENNNLGPVFRARVASYFYNLLAYKRFRIQLINDWRFPPIKYFWDRFKLFFELRSSVNAVVSMGAAAVPDLFDWEIDQSLFWEGRDARPKEIVKEIVEEKGTSVLQYLVKQQLQGDTALIRDTARKFIWAAGVTGASSLFPNIKEIPLPKSEDGSEPASSPMSSPERDGKDSLPESALPRMNKGQPRPNSTVKTAGPAVADGPASDEGLLSSGTLGENDFRDFMAAARQVWDRQDAQIESLIRSAERDVKLENNAAIPDDHADFLGLIALFNHSPAFLKKMAATQRIIAEVLDDQEKLANPKATHTAKAVYVSTEHMTLNGQIMRDWGREVDAVQRDMRAELADLSRFSFDVVGPHLMTSMSVTFELDTDSQALIAAKRRVYQRSLARNPEVTNPNILHSSVAYIHQATEEQLLTLNRRLREERERLKTEPIKIPVDRLSVAKGRMNRTFCVTEDRWHRDIELAPTVQQPVSSANPANTNDVGGIDLNAINVDRQGAGVDIHFEPVMMQDMLKNGVEGFAPVFINFTPLPSVLPILGLEPRGREEEFEVSRLNDY